MVTPGQLHSDHVDMTQGVFLKCQGGSAGPPEGVVVVIAIMTFRFASIFVHSLALS